MSTSSSPLGALTPPTSLSRATSEMDLVADLDAVLPVVDPPAESERSLDRKAPLTPERQLAQFTPVGKYVLCAFGLFLMLTSALVTTGWPAIRPVFLANGVYLELCTRNETEWRVYGGRNVTICNAQEVRLNVMSNVALGVQNGMAPIMGFIIDRFGPKITVSLSAVLISSAYMFLAFADSRTFDAYVPAFALLSLGGAAAILSSFHLANLFPQRRALLLALIVACGQCSNALMYLVHLLYFEADLPLRTVWLILLVFPLLSTVHPRRPLRAMRAAHLESFNFHFRTFGSLFRAPPVYLLFAWSLVVVSTTYFYVVTVEHQLYWLLGDRVLAAEGARIYSILFMFVPVGVLATGWLTQRFGTSAGFTFLSALFLLHSVLCFVPVYGVQFVNFVAFLVARASLFSLMGHYCNLMFGPYFSRVFGLSLMVGGLFTFSNIGWNYVALVVLDGNFLPVLVPMQVLEVSLTVLLAVYTHLWRT